MRRLARCHGRVDGPVHDLPNPSQHASKEDKGLGYIVILLQVPSPRDTRIINATTGRWHNSLPALLRLPCTDHVRDIHAAYLQY